MKFLTDEIMPEVKRAYRLSHDPDMHAICGASSGAIAAFTVAWERPNEFRKVLSTIGSFTNLAGGNAYPSLIRKTERKPIRVYQEDASGDVINEYGDWPLANKQLHAALKYMGYDARFDFAEGYAHNSNHGGSIFPEALKWLWRKETPKPELNLKGDLGGDMTLHRLLIDGEDWKLVSEGYGFTDGPCTDAEERFTLLLGLEGATAIYEIAQGRHEDEAARRAGQRIEIRPRRKTLRLPAGEEASRLDRTLNRQDRTGGRGRATE